MYDLFETKVFFFFNELHFDEKERQRRRIATLYTAMAANGVSNGVQRRRMAVSKLFTYGKKGVCTSFREEPNLKGR